MRIIEISDDKFEEMSEHAEKVMRHGKKLMECFEELCEDGMGERRGMGRGGMNMRDYDDYDDYDDMDERSYGRGGYGMRRGRSARTGRYVSR